VLHKSELKNRSRGTAYIKKKTQIASNYDEKGKIRTFYCGGEGEQDGYPSHPAFQSQWIWDCGFGANSPWSCGFEANLH